MTVQRQEVLVAAYRDPARARAAVEALEAAGVPPEEISVLMRRPEDAEEVAEGTGADTVPATGGLSDLAGWLAGVSAYAVPGVGPVASTGLLAAALISVQAGPGEGVITGALVGLGVPVDDAARWEEQVRAGRVLVAVRSSRGADAVPRILGRAIPD